MSSNDTPIVRAKKGVALSGIVAGSTALCTVGRSGNDLNYCGYDINDLAETCEFEEVAYLLIHGKLPNAAQLANYKTKLKGLRGLPLPVKAVLEALPAAAHPMDVMRTGCSALGCALPEKEDHNVPGARDIADRLVASFGSMLLYWYHYSTNGRRIEVETDDDSVGGHFLHLLNGKNPARILCAPCIRHSFCMRSMSSTPPPSPAAWLRARARTCIRRSLAASARCAGPNTAAPMKSALK